LLQVSPADRLGDEIESNLHALFSWGSERTPEQDVMLPVERLLEIAGKALSPGVNNQYTAILCINQLERGLAAMLSRRVPDSRRVDANGTLRVIAEPIGHTDFVDRILRPLRQYVNGDWIATHHLVRSLGRLIAMPELRSSLEMLTDRAELVIAEAGESRMTKEHLEHLVLTWRHLRSPSASAVSDRR
jgi:uncharacterized membrane protein